MGLGTLFVMSNRMVKEGQSQGEVHKQVRGKRLTLRAPEMSIRRDIFVCIF